MKFIKKTAALFFCLTLALSVMAVSALASDPTPPPTPTFTVALQEAVTHGDVNENDYQEYARDTLSIAYNVVLSVSGATNTVVVKALQFDVGTNADSSETLDWTTRTLAVSGANLSAGVAANMVEVYNTDDGTRYEIAVPGNATGFELTSDNNYAATIATLTIGVSPTTGYKGSVALSNVIVKDLADNESETANGGQAKVEIDPIYTVLIKNYTIDENSNITHTLDSGTSYEYGILAGFSGAITEPSQSYYTFDNYEQEGTNNEIFSVTDLASTSSLVSALKDHEHWGNVTLKPAYTSIKWPITVRKPELDTNDGTAKTTYENDSVSYLYDIEGTVYDSEGTSGSLAEVELANYDFQNFIAVMDATNNNWAGTETYDANASAVAVGKHGNVTFKAVYKAHPYTISFVLPQVDANGIFGDTPNTDSNTSMTYTIEGKVSGDAGAGNALIPSRTQAAYTFQHYTVSNNTGTAWTDSTVNAGDIGAGKYGNVTLTAVFSPISYTVTYALGGGNFTDTDATAPGGGNSEFNTTLVYTIEDTDDTGFSFGIPVRANYTFDGWTATAGNGDISSTFTAMTTADKIDSPVGLWGNVTLTAQWTADGKFVTSVYKYAYSSDHLILFAVKKDPDATGGYTYQDGAEGTPAAMFVVSSKYEVLFTDDNALDKENGQEWVIYGYIATFANADIKNVQYNAEVTNTEIDYNGDMTQNTKIDAGDYGNVIALLGNSNQYTNAQLGVRARLEADVTVETGAGADEAGRWFGTIDDVKAIMNAALSQT